MTKRRMTQMEFDALQPLLNKMKENRIEAARLALVEGLTLQEIANRNGWLNRQAAGDAVKIVWKAYEKQIEAQRLANNTILPPGWEQVTIVAPTWLIERFRLEIAEASRLENKKAQHAMNVPG